MSNQVGVCQGRSQLAWKSLSNEENMNPSSERMLRKNRRGVCNIKLIQFKLHPTQGLFDAIPKLAMWPSDCRGLTVSVGHSVMVHGRFVAGQCLLPLTLFMIAPVDPCPYWGNKMKKKNKRKKMTRESKIAIGRSQHTFWETVDEITAQ